MNRVNLHVLNDQKTYQIQPGQKLSDILTDLGYTIDKVCAGKGTCGKCSVTLKDSKPSREELSCLYEVTESLEIYIPEKHQLQALTEHALSATGSTEYSKHLLDIKTQEAIKAHVLSEYLQGEGWEIESLEILRKLSSRLIESNQDLTLVIRNHCIIDVQDGDTRDHLYGMAVDIGTTSVVIYLLDMARGTIVHTISSLNSQSTFGADVISRIEYATTGDKHLDRLQREIVDTIGQMLSDDSLPKDITQHIYSTCLCGNTTMHHLFFGINPYALGVAPYQPATRDSIRIKAHEAGIQVNPHGDVEFLPILGGYVGADTLSVLLTVPEDEKIRLVIDLGTNGEIAVGGKNSYRVASTACGPAFEGAGITCGMRGTKGAIEAVWIDQKDLKFKVIDGGLPKGICGSGIVDLVAVLLEAGVIQKTGLLHSKKSFERKFGDHPMLERLDTLEGQRVFYLSQADGIYLSQKDIRNIQLAKSAVYSGCKILAEGHDIHEILVAGAFGNYMNLGSARRIGLIPSYEECNTKSVGNAAGTGVMEYLLSSLTKERATVLLNDCTHVRLAEMAAFQGEYIENMGF